MSDLSETFSFRLHRRVLHQNYRTSLQLIAEGLYVHVHPFLTRPGHHRDSTLSEYQMGYVHHPQ